MGPWLAAAAVIFDGTILAYIMACVLYAFFRATQEPMTARRVLVLFSVTGVFASQLVHWFEHFRQPALSAFADSWLSPIFGCLCGLTAGACFALFANRRFLLRTTHGAVGATPLQRCFRSTPGNDRGSSPGGLAATYAAYRHPEMFGNVLSQSGSYWWTPPTDPSKPSSFDDDAEPGCPMN